GGPGRYRGGNGLGTAFIAHKAAALGAQSLSIDPALNGTLGLGGGYPGNPGAVRGRPDAGISAVLAAGGLPGDRAALEAAVGDLPRVAPNGGTDIGDDGVLVVEYCASGGFGDPLRRDPGRVAADVSDGALTPEVAGRCYGVVLEDGAVDEAATRQRRDELRQGRVEAARPPASPLDVGPVEPDGIVLRVTDGVGLARHGTGLVWACSACRRALAPAGENFRQGCGRLERAPHQVDEMYPDPTEYGDEPFVIRQWICPGCGQLASTEFCRPGDEPLWDIRLADHALAELARTGPPSPGAEGGA
ncbi:MAG TPA: acetone carboxylase subunit gamma, partial [Acidimicrobiia bacterium]|nr:acetone carboxylase subunit gamma [Acidimicrobiia bacterium]